MCMCVCMYRVRACMHVCPAYRSYTRIWKKISVGGIVYFTVLCDHPYLVSLLFAVLVSLHPVTFYTTIKPTIVQGH